jgi:hypothetical protein
MSVTGGRTGDNSIFFSGKEINEQDSASACALGICREVRKGGWSGELGLDVSGSS